MNQLKDICCWTEINKNTIHNGSLINIETIDNPGWGLEVSFDSTALSNAKMEKIKVNRTEEDWIFATIRDGVFFSAGGALNLEELLDIFLNIIHQTTTPKIYEKSSDLTWLMQWYQSYCNEDWEHSFGVRVVTTAEPGWQVEIDIEETGQEDKNFERVFINNDRENWMECYVEKRKFIGKCSINNLESVLKIFRNWVES